MNDLITLELKQNQSGHVNANGDYNTVLIKPIDIEEGDEISISKVFIDTADQAQTTIQRLMPQLQRTELLDIERRYFGGA